MKRQSDLNNACSDYCKVTKPQSKAHKNKMIGKQCWIYLWTVLKVRHSNFVYSWYSRTV